MGDHDGVTRVLGGELGIAKPAVAPQDDIRLRFIDLLCGGDVLFSHEFIVIKYIVETIAHRFIKGLGRHVILAGGQF